MTGLRTHATGAQWMPGAGGMCVHTILLDPVRPQRMHVAISAAGTFRSDDGGESWRPVNKGLRSLHIPDPVAEVGHCVHRIARHPARPDTLFMQKHWDAAAVSGRSQTASADSPALCQATKPSQRRLR